MSGRLTRPIKPDAGRGFTLAESLIASSVLAVAVAGILSPLGASFENSRYAEESFTASSLARQLLDEIATRAYADPDDDSLQLGPEMGETTRAQFDNVDDYHLYSDSTDQMQTLDGRKIDFGVSGIYRREVRVEFRDSPGGSAASSGNFAMVTVTITTPRGEQVSFRQMFCNYPRG